jgi:hypothetical protein
MPIKDILRKFILATRFVLYAVFYWPYIFGGNIIKSGDAESLHYPGIYYLKESLSEGSFPFFSERIFSGFPVYQNSEFAYLNPVRVLLTLLLNPEYVLKTEHILYFTLGTFGMWLFARKLNFSPAGYLFAHSVYFYSVQSVARFTHTNIIYVYFLLPLCLYYLEKFIESKNKKWVFMLSLVNVLGIYYGNFNAVLISMIAQGIFFLCSVDVIKQRVNVSRFVLLLTFWVVTLSIPILFTSGALYLTSVRESGGISYAQGSASGLYLLVNFLHPYPFGVGDSYAANGMKNTWLFHENSVYPGVSVLIISFVSFFLVKTSRLKKFFLINFILFLLLATLNYSPFGKFFNFFPVSLFRYWVRYAVIFHLSLAFLGGAFLSNFQKQEPSKKTEFIKNLLLILVPVGLLVFLTLYNLKSYTSKVIIDYLISIFPYGILYKQILVILSVSSFILTVVLLKMKKPYLMFSLAVIATFDILYFSHIALLDKLEPRRDLINRKIYSASESLKNDRVVYLDRQIKGNTPLYYKTWGLFGYSVSFEQKNYTDFLFLFDMSSRRFKEFRPDYLDKFGTKAFVYEDGSYRVLDNRGDLVFNNEGLTTEVTLKEEGEFVVNIRSNSKKEVTTKVRNFPGWDIKIDGQKTDFSNATGDVFLKFWVNEGASRIHLKYYPVHLYYSLEVSALFLLITLTVHKKLKFS